MMQWKPPSLVVRQGVRSATEAVDPALQRAEYTAPGTYPWAQKGDVPMLVPI
jgi:hypothetical protein